MLDLLSVSLEYAKEVKRDSLYGLNDFGEGNYSANEFLKE